MWSMTVPFWMAATMSSSRFMILLGGLRNEWRNNEVSRVEWFGGHGLDCDSERVADDGLSCVESVACLLEIVGVWVVVHVVGNFVDSRQWVQDFHCGFGVFQHGCFQDIDVFDSFIFHEVCESFPLDSGHVEDVGVGDDVSVELLFFDEGNVSVLAVDFVFLGHGEFFGCDEVEGGIEVSHRHDERVYGSSVFEVSDEIDVQIVESSLCFVDAVEVQQGLCGMLVRSVSRIDDGHG